MNIKLHTPKSLKAGSGMASLKQFLLSLFATSVSIALTFGTAAIIEYKSKQNAKREIVMMVMYDMYNSLESIDNTDSLIIKAMDAQLKLAEDTTRLSELWNTFMMSMPSVDFTETTERIFSSNVETINTVGNVLFTENVAQFYLYRKRYKTMVCDSLCNNMMKTDPFTSAKSTLSFEYKPYAIMSSGIRFNMRNTYRQCKEMMNVSDGELDAYLEERKEMEQDKKYSSEENIAIIGKITQIQNELDDAKKKLNL